MKFQLKDDFIFKIMLLMSGIRVKKKRRKTKKNFHSFSRSEKQECEKKKPLSFNSILKTRYIV